MPNPFLASIIAHEEKGASLKRHQHELQTLKDNGIGPLKVEEKFDKAEMADEYRSIYHFESDATHNSMQALIGRHFKQVGDGFELELYMQGGSLNEYVTYLDASAALLLDATDRLHERLQSGKQGSVKALLAELSEVRANAERMTTEG
jgi:hypothetical protein